MVYPHFHSQSFQTASLYMTIIAILLCSIYFFFYAFHKNNKLTVHLDEALAEKRELQVKYTELQLEYKKFLIECKKFVVEYREEQAKQGEMLVQYLKVAADLKADAKEDLGRTMDQSNRTIKQLVEIIKSKDTVIEMYREMLDQSRKMATDMKNTAEETVRDTIRNLKEGTTALKE